MEENKDGIRKRRMKIGGVIAFIVVSGFFAFNMVEVEEYPRRDIKLRINAFDQTLKQAIIPKNFGVDFKKKKLFEKKGRYAGGLWSSKVKVHGIKVKMPLTPDVFHIQALKGNKLRLNLKFKSNSKKYDFMMRTKFYGSVSDLISKPLISGSTEVHVKEFAARVVFDFSDSEFGVENARLEGVKVKLDIKKDRGLVRVINKLGTFGAKVGKLLGVSNCSTLASCINIIINAGVIPLILPDLQAQVNDMMKETLKTLKADIKNMLPREEPTRARPGFALDEVPYIQTERIDGNRYATTFILPVRLSTLPFGECARDFEIVTDNVDDFKGSDNINEKSGRSHLQVFLGSGALIDVIHSTLGARGDYLCRKGVRPMKLANQTLSMEYETSPKLLKMNINEEGEDTKATLRFEFDVFGKSIGSNEPEEDKKRSLFSGKFQLPFNSDVEFEGRVFAEFSVRFFGNVKRGIFIKPMYEEGGVIDPVLRINGSESRGSELNRLFTSMIEPHLKRINKRNRIKLPVKPVIPLQNEMSGDLLWAGMHDKKGMEVRFKVVPNNFKPTNWE